jgi:hypothetical protein
VVDSGLRQEEWQFPAQILPLVSETIAQAGFSIVKVWDVLGLYHDELIL